MCEAEDELISALSKRLRDRKLFKCVDVRTRVAHAIDPKGQNSDDEIEKVDKCCAAINQRLEDWSVTHGHNVPRVLVDSAERSPYKPLDKSKGPLDRINILTDGGALVDLKERSSVVSALKSYKLFRVYSDEFDTEARQAIESITEGEIAACR
jgi:hypothetical protein